MKCIFLLSGDYIDLAKEEICSLFKVVGSKSNGRLFIANIKNNEKEIKELSKRLALTKGVYRILFECKIDELVKSMNKYDWSSVYKDNFCLRINAFNHGYSEKYLAKYVWRSVKNPKVDLENPKTLIEIFIVDDEAYCGLLIFHNSENFELRKPHLRPFPHPSSMHPKLARALVNISGVKEGEVLLDPFCGTGGFLIEAGLIGIKAIGYDISKNMAKGCKDNLKHFGIKKFTIKNKNASEITDKFDCVVTDLPYGLNSNIYLKYSKKSIDEKSNKINLKINKTTQIKNIEKFYLKFLKKLRKILKKKAVIIFPSYVNYKKLLKTAKFGIEREFEIYVHRSLTRKIVKIE